MGLINDTVEYMKYTTDIPDVKEGSKGDYIYYISVILNYMGYTCEYDRIRNKSIEIAIKNLQHDLGLEETGSIETKHSKEYKAIRNFALNNLELI